MLDTPHAVVGAAIAASIPNPYVALPLAFASHFLLDITPHWNPHLNTELNKNGKITPNTTALIIGDSALGLVLSFAIASTAYPDYGRMMIILLGAFAAIFPDLIKAPHYFLKYNGKWLMDYIAWDKKIQADASLIPGIATQVIVVIAALIWTF